MNKAKALQKITEEVSRLKDNDLVVLRKNNNYIPVIGGGSLDAKIMLIGEAPGENEAKTGVPFIGRSGKFLDELILSVGLERENIYITSIVKDRPPKNRDPRPDEIAEYAPFLDRQIEMIQPKVIGALGRFAMVYIMERYGLKDQVASISGLHGKVFDAELPYGIVKFVPLYHPAAAIYNQKLKGTLIEDFKVLKTVIF
jgi:uracil-DNA glycosylase family 4